MTEQDAKIKDLELRVKKLEDKVFDVWLAQYEPKANWYVGLTAPENSNKNKWIDVPPEEKAAIMFPDMSTLPLNDIEKKHVYEMFEFKDPDAWRVEFDES